MASERTAAQVGKHGRGPPRPDGHAALLRLSHGRLLRALAVDGPADGQSPADLPRQLVPHRRERQVPLAGLRREPPRDRVDPRPLPRRGRRHADADRLRAHAREPRPQRPRSSRGEPRKALRREPQRLVCRDRGRGQLLPAVRRAFPAGLVGPVGKPAAAAADADHAPEAGRGDPSPGQGAQRHHRAREPARLRHAFRPGQAALLPQGHPGPERRGQGQGQALRRHDRHRAGEGQADVPALGDEVFQRPHARRGLDLRPGHGPRRPAEEMARGTDPQEPQPGRARASRCRSSPAA